MNKQIGLKYKNKKLTGILINKTDNFMILKLASGYNANLKLSEVKIISEKEIELKNNVSKLDGIKKKNLPRVTIIHTGGTIASKVDYRTGAVSSQFTAEELLGIFPELNEKANISAKMVANIFSEDMRFSEYNLLLDEINNAIAVGSKGVIISHGTDTMHYTSAALQYACKNLSIPVILMVGPPLVKTEYSESVVTPA